MTETTTSTKVAVITELVKQLEISSEEVHTINTDFNSMVAENPGVTIYDLVKVCGLKYDHEAFLIGAIVSASIIEMVNGLNTQKTAENNRLNNIGMEFM